MWPLGQGLSPKWVNIQEEQRNSKRKKVYSLGLQVVGVRSYLDVYTLDSDPEVGMACIFTTYVKQRSRWRRWAIVLHTLAR